MNLLLLLSHVNIVVLLEKNKNKKIDLYKILKYIIINIILFIGLFDISVLTFI